MIDFYFKTAHGLFSCILFHSLQQQKQNNSYSDIVLFLNTGSESKSI